MKPGMDQSDVRGAPCPSGSIQCGWSASGYRFLFLSAVRDDEAVSALP